jgi:hypothetical protein
MNGDNFLLDEAHAELFSGPKIFTVPGEGFACIRLTAGRHDLTLTSEAPFLVVVVPASELDPAK